MYRLTTCLLLLLLPGWLQAQNVTLRQARVYEGDVVLLTLTHDAGIPSMYAIDSTALNADFELLDSRSRMFRIQQEGRSLHRMQWVAKLLPRRSGFLEIPPLKVGENYSEALQLEVEPVPADIRRSQKLFVEIEAIPANPYPGQQTRVVTRLFHNLELDNSALGEPEAGKTPTYRSGRERRYSITRDGETFSVLERSLLMIPPAGDELQVRAARIDARLPLPEPREGERLDGEFRYIHRKSNELRLRLRDLPDDADASAWLPARSLTLSLEREERSEPLRPGASLSVTLKLRASGLSADELPANLLLRDSERFKIYADQEVRSTRVIGEPGAEHLQAQLQQRYVILFEQAGEMTLPELRIDWWDVERDQARVAQLEAANFQVLPSLATGGSLDELNGILTNDAKRYSGALPVELRQLWPWAAIALLGLLLAGFGRQLREPFLSLTRYITRRREIRNRRRQLEEACRNNNAAMARRWLIEWGRAVRDDPHINSLRQLAALTGSPAWTSEMERLDAAVFSASRSGWQGKELRDLLRQEQRIQLVAKRAEAVDQLPDPYPRNVSSPRPATTP